MRRIHLVSALIIFMVSGNAAAFDDKVTHPEMATQAIQNSAVNSYLAEVLGLPNHTETIVDGKSLRVWLREGARLEDDPMCRAVNHFHNPLRDWTESGMRDQPWFVNKHCSSGEYLPQNIRSAVHWATSYTQPQAPGITRDATANQWHWDRAREFFYTHLTGRNFLEEEVAPTEATRNAYLVSSFQALGQVLHLLEDMAVPAHVRDDFKSHLDWNGITLQTIIKPTKWLKERFEYFVENEGITSEASVMGDVLDFMYKR
jgi:hypothetical protein